MSKTLVAAMLGAVAGLACCRTAPAAEDIISYNPNENHFIVDWLVSREHRFPFAYLGAALNYDALAAAGGEKACAPRPGEKATGGTDWEDRHFKPSGYAAGACVFKPCSYSFTYAFAYLYCDQEQKGIQMLTGSDDGLLVVLNGEVVLRAQIQRGYATDQDLSIVTLRKGWNRLLCKIDDYSGGHGLCLRFRNADGQFFDDYKICFDRPHEGSAVRFVDGVAYEASASTLLKAAASLQAEKGDLDAAVAKCREVVAQYPKAQAAAEAMYRLGELQAKAGRTDQALEALAELRAKYPNSKWVEDALLAQSEIWTARRDVAAAEKALAELVSDHPKSNLASEALLRLATLQLTRKDLDAADVSFAAVRRQFPNTVEAVKALEGLADNQRARGKSSEAADLYRQVIEECRKLSEGKYVFFVNVQAVLRETADSARAKLDAIR